MTNEMSFEDHCRFNIQKITAELRKVSQERVCAAQQGELEALRVKRERYQITFKEHMSWRL